MFSVNSVIVDIHVTYSYCTAMLILLFYGLNSLFKLAKCVDGEEIEEGKKANK